ncbi:MAG: hypothetical protein ACTSSN_13405 [Candidatus Heimdallarchaeaceae archaeon]
MPRFLFYSQEGLTYTPYIDDSLKGGKEIENLQIIGFAQGDTPQEAFDELLYSNGYLIGSTFDQVTAVELKEQEYKTFGFSLESIREQQ